MSRMTSTDAHFEIRTFSKQYQTSKARNHRTNNLKPALS